MKITLDLDKLGIPVADRRAIGQRLGAENETEIQAKLEALAKAALLEYRAMLLRGGMPARLEELQQLRLSYMIRHLFMGNIPTEAQVARVMQLTPRKARALLCSTLVRYGHELDDGFRQRLIECLADAILDNASGRYEVVLASDTIVDGYNRLLEQVAPSLDPVRRIRNTLRRFAISEDAYNALRRALELA